MPMIYVRPPNPDPKQAALARHIARALATDGWLRTEVDEHELRQLPDHISAIVVRVAQASEDHAILDTPYDPLPELRLRIRHVLTRALRGDAGGSEWRDPAGSVERVLGAIVAAAKEVGEAEEPGCWPGVDGEGRVMYAG